MMIKQFVNQYQLIVLYSKFPHIYLLYIYTVYTYILYRICFFFSNTRKQTGCNRNICNMWYFYLFAELKKGGVSFYLTNLYIYYILNFLILTRTKNILKGNYSYVIQNKES